MRKITDIKDGEQSGGGWGVITFRIRGQVVADESGAVLAGLPVEAHDKARRFDDLLGGAVTDGSGRFEIVMEPRDFRDLFSKRPLLYFTVYASDAKTRLYTTARGVKWTPGRLPRVEIRVPAKVSFPEKGIRISLEGDQSGSQKEFQVGDSIALAARGLRPGTAYDTVVSSDGKDLFASRLLSDARGAIEPTVIWPQVGLEDPSSEERLTIDEAGKRWGDRAFAVELRLRKKRVAVARFQLRPANARPVFLSTDAEGRVLNGFEVGEQPALLLVRNLAFRGVVRVYMVPSQAGWRVGDGFVPATFADGSPAVREFEMAEETGPFEFAPADLLPTGAYDFVLRPLRYGYEEDEQGRILERDIVSGHRVTGLVIREPFWEAKPVLGGCVNKLPISGRSVDEAPYLQYADTFEVGEDVYGALDPGIVHPDNVSKQCAFYVIPSKDATQWGADTSLNHLAVLGGNTMTPKASVQAFCINASKRLLWASAQDVGEYDVVADFGNNTPSQPAFVPDDSYDTPLDIIDGYFVAGFRIVHDPGTFSDSGLFAGTWNYQEGDVTAMGLQGTVTVDDEVTGYATPGVFSTVSRQVRLKANVCFPADSPGISDPAQTSASKPDYPLVVIIHGNGHDYTTYDFLLQHFARNGFVAASIDNRHLVMGSPSHGMHGLGRANNFFKHLDVLRTKFGTRLQNNIGVMGHSRGGEAVTKIARLNSQQGLGNGINATLALAPTDQYGREAMGGFFATPFLVVYGSRDGDVAGGPPGGSFTWRRSGFSLYDRAEDADKSMAFVYRATHNGFITANTDNPSDVPLLSVPAQRSIIQAYANGFFRRHLRSEPEWEGMLQGDWKPASVVATGAEVYLQHRRPGGRVVDDFEGTPNWQSSSISGTVDHAGSLPVNPGEGRLVDAPGAPGLDTQSPHDSGGMRIRWDNLGDRLTWTIPSGQGDLTGFATLSLRVTQTEASASNPANQPQDLRIGLRDSDNNERAVRVGAFTLIPYPDQRSSVSLRKSALMTVRIPLTAYTIVCAGQVQVKLDDVTHLFLDFSTTPTGEIEIDEIEFTA